jgi:hypothetical protein
MKFLNFFLLSWVIFALLDPEPESGYGSTDLIESGSETRGLPAGSGWSRKDWRGGWGAGRGWTAGWAAGRAGNPILNMDRIRTLMARGSCLLFIM